MSWMTFDICKRNITMIYRVLIVRYPESIPHVLYQSIPSHSGSCWKVTDVIWVIELSSGSKHLLTLKEKG
jgi:hypothetical protein